jgi:hypothetical protein
MGVDTIPAEQFAALAKARTAQPVPVRRFVTEEPRLDAGVLRDVVMSTEAEDRGRDVIRQGNAWETANFEANPVLQWAHDYSMPPIGQVRGVDRGSRLVGRELVFLSEDMAAPGMVAEHLKFAAMIGRMYTHERRFLRAFSIGMRPLEWNYNEERGGVDFLRQELLELSACAIPMNQDCLSGAKSAGIDMAPLIAAAERRLDGDVSAPAWLPTKDASLVYRSLSAPRVAVPAPVDEAAIVQRVLSAVRAATPAPAPPPAKATPQQAADFAAKYLSTRLAEITGRVTLTD